MTIIQLRRDSAADWTSNNPVLAAGEAGWEADTDSMKVGDGTTAWTSLGYTLAGGVTAWTAVTFENSWVNYGLGWAEGEYRKVGDVVQIRGLVKSGTITAGDAFFTLPTGYRPTTRHMFTTASNALLARFDVTTAGAVVIGDTGTPSATWFWLEGSFSTV